MNRVRIGFRTLPTIGLRSLFMLMFILSLAPQATMAHQLRFAYLQIDQTDTERYSVLFKSPSRGADQPVIKFPSHCKSLVEQSTRVIANASLRRWDIQCPGGLVGERIAIAGLSEQLPAVLARLANLDGTSEVARMTVSESSFVVADQPDALSVSRSYFKLGVEHILLGADHLLFVFALLLIVDQGRRLLITITAFTLAHSITLALAALNVVHVPPAPVEAVIALSIVFVARELLRLQQGQPSLTARKPWLVAFSFGLLHGLGFASALREVGLPQLHIPIALLFFNIGVEAGQLLFVAMILTGWRLLSKLKWPQNRWVKRIPPYAIGSVAMFWVFERLSAF